MVPFLRTLTWRHRMLPFVLALALGALTLSWNAAVGMSWTGPRLWQIVLGSTPLLLIAACAAKRGMYRLGEATLFACMYLVVPLVGVRLSYLATTLDFPFVDSKLNYFDHSLGFDWAAWAHFIGSHPWLHGLTLAAYMSPVVQALISTAIFSGASPGKRNFEVLFTLVLALIVVIFIYTLFPELGPGSIIGRHYQFESNILELRAGRLGPFPYTGIVSFPSYHTVMAIVFIYGHRGLKYSFWPVVVLNGLMLLGTPTFGVHYLCDMFGGAAIAAGAILITRSIYGSKREEVYIGVVAHNKELSWLGTGRSTMIEQKVATFV